MPFAACVAAFAAASRLVKMRSFRGQRQSSLATSMPRRQHSENALAQPPSPPGSLPVVGHFHMLGLGSLGIPTMPEPHIIMASLARTFGKVMSLRFGSSTVVLLSSPLAVEDALTCDRGRAAGGRPALPSVQANGLSQGFSSARWDRGLEAMRSALLRQAFASPAVHRAAPLVREEAQRLVLALRRQTGEPVAIGPLLRHALTGLLFRWLLSLDPTDPEAVELEKLIEESWATMTDPITTAADFIRMPGFASSLPDICERRSAILKAFVARRRRQHGSGQRFGDTLDAILAEQRREGLDESIVIETIQSLFTAGISTVSTSLLWLLLLFARYPDAQATARLDALGRGHEGYLEACICETLRLKTPLFVPRRCLQSLQVQGYHIPADTVLLPDSYALAHDPELWRGGPVDEFHPERFLGPEAPLLKHLPGVRPRCPFTGAEKEAADTPYKFLPFGSGARFCVGAPLALLELRTFAQELLVAFQWEAEGEVDLSESYSFTLTPKTPAQLIFRAWG